MPTKTSRKNKMRAIVRKERKNLEKLKKENPELFRRCGKENAICCQARTQDGKLCTRPAMTNKTYIKKLRCCYLCWQHALVSGVYAFYKLANLASTAQMDWDTYCALYPQECDKMLETIKKH